MSSSLESAVLIKHFSTLQSVLQPDLSAAVDALIDGGVVDKVDLTGSSGQEVATFLHQVMKAVESDSHKWQSFLEVLGKLQNASSLVEKIEADYCKNLLVVVLYILYMHGIIYF